VPVVVPPPVRDIIKFCFFAAAGGRGLPTLAEFFEFLEDEEGGLAIKFF